MWVCYKGFVLFSLIINSIYMEHNMIISLGLFPYLTVPSNE